MFLRMSPSIVPNVKGGEGRNSFGFVNFILRIKYAKNCQRINAKFFIRNGPEHRRNNMTKKIIINFYVERTKQLRDKSDNTFSDDNFVLCFKTMSV